MTNQTHRPIDSAAEGEYDMLLRLVVTDPIAEDRLEPLADAALAAVEDHATSVAFGTVVGWTLEPQEVRLDMTIEADTKAEARTLLKHVAEIVKNEVAQDFDFSVSREFAAC